MRRAKEQARALADHFRVHGTPEARDLGRILMVRRQFPLVDDSAFARILGEATDPITSAIAGAGAEVVKAIISKP